MNTTLICRVILIPDGTVHIVFKDKHSIICTPNALADLLSNPQEFIVKLRFDYKRTSKTTNPNSRDLEDVTGLTLIKIFGDYELSFVFPKLFNAFVSGIRNCPDEPINLKETVYGLKMSDEKDFLLRFFCELTNTHFECLECEEKFKACPELRSVAINETYKSCYFDFFDVEAKNQPSGNQSTSVENNFPKPLPGDLGEEMIPYGDYAKLHNTTTKSLSEAKSRGKLETVVKVGRNNYINKNEPLPEDGRAGRKVTHRVDKGTKRSDLLSDSYDDVQRFLAENEGLSPNVRVFFHTKEEAKYYRTHHYRQVNWNGKWALITDINPDWYCEELGKTNRELIQSGRSPVVADNYPVVWDVHHVGQHPKSPFAIIRSDHHTGEYNSMFHVKKQQPEVLHGQTFESQKKSFWSQYLKMYDITKNFNDIDGICLATAYRKIHDQNAKKKETKMKKIQDKQMVMSI